MAGQIFLPLREAVAEVLRIEGLSLLDKPKAFRSCLLDVADQSRPDVSLLEQQLDASVLERSCSESNRYFFENRASSNTRRFGERAIRQGGPGVERG